jgi:hypothetical protein
MEKDSADKKVLKPIESKGLGEKQEKPKKNKDFLLVASTLAIIGYFLYTTGMLDGFLGNKEVVEKKKISTKYSKDTNSSEVDKRAIEAVKRLKKEDNITSSKVKKDLFLSKIEMEKERKNIVIEENKITKNDEAKEPKNSEPIEDANKSTSTLQRSVNIVKVSNSNNNKEIDDLKDVVETLNTRIESLSKQNREALQEISKLKKTIELQKESKQQEQIIDTLKSVKCRMKYSFARVYTISKEGDVEKIKEPINGEKGKLINVIKAKESEYKGDLMEFVEFENGKYINKEELLCK